MSTTSNNAESLEREIGWFSNVLETRFALYFSQPCEHQSIDEINPPDLRPAYSFNLRISNAFSFLGPGSLTNS